MRNREYISIFDNSGDSEYLDGWTLLRNAVIMKASEDYVCALTHILLTKPGGEFSTKDIVFKNDVESFLFSDYFQKITDISPMEIIRRCRKEALSITKSVIETRIMEDINGQLKGF